MNIFATAHRYHLGLKPSIQTYMHTHTRKHTQTHVNPPTCIHLQHKRLNAQKQQFGARDTRRKAYFLPMQTSKLALSIHTDIEKSLAYTNAENSLDKRWKETCLYTRREYEQKKDVFHGYFCMTRRRLFFTAFLRCVVAPRHAIKSRCCSHWSHALISYESPESHRICLHTHMKVRIPTLMCARKHHPFKTTYCYLARFVALFFQRNSKYLCVEPYQNFYHLSVHMLMKTTLVIPYLCTCIWTYAHMKTWMHAVMNTCMRADETGDIALPENMKSAVMQSLTVGLFMNIWAYIQMLCIYIHLLCKYIRTRSGFSIKRGLKSQK